MDTTGYLPSKATATDKASISPSVIVNFLPPLDHKCCPYNKASLLSPMNLNVLSLYLNFCATGCLSLL